MKDNTMNKLNLAFEALGGEEFHKGACLCGPDNDPCSYCALFEALEATKALLSACEFVLSRTDLLTRWPCPDCGRESPEGKRRLNRVHQTGGKIIWTGCWLCNTDDVRECVRDAITGMK